MDERAAPAADFDIEREYIDARGARRSVPAHALRRLVAALGNTGTQSPTPAPLLWRRGRTEDLLQAVAARGWQLVYGEDESVAIAGDALQIPATTPIGVCHLRQVEETSVIVAPERAYQLNDIGADRIWVLALQLYAIRSHRNWGHGDFTDLANLVRLAAEIGAAGIGLNPLHALFEDRAEQASPYSPNSRLFLNSLYIDVEAVPEFAGGDAGGLAAEIERLRATELVDYAAVATAKRQSLRLVYQRFRKRGSPRRRGAFKAFRERHGETLGRFAAFEVLRRRFPSVWWEWPEEWRRPTEEALKTLRKEAAEDIGYYEFVQWIADEQLATCQAEAKRLGLAVGLYIDLAVGVEPGGADAWAEQDSIIQQVEVGAPPDLLNTAGQAWGVAAFNPRALEQKAFAPFIDVLRAAMRHAGGIRLDHVLGLNRLYLIPFGCSPQDGAYVRYPLQALLAVAAIESVRHRCLVIGEDLGTVPDELRDILADWGIWSYMVMMFERRADGTFKLPDEYRRDALVTFSTHDLATFEGWRAGHDLEVKRAAGLDPGESDEDRSRACWLLGEALARNGVGEDRAWEFVDILRFLARTPSRLLMIEIDDILGLADQPNVPGTVHEHPNWRRRLPVALDELATHRDLRSIADVLAQEGRASPSMPMAAGQAAG